MVWQFIESSLSLYFAKNCLLILNRYNVYLVMVCYVACSFKTPNIEVCYKQMLTLCVREDQQ